MVFMGISSTFFLMEVRHHTLGQLIMVADELGPVENEHIFFLIIFLSGLKGTNFYPNSVLEFTGIKQLEWLTYHHLLAGLLFFLEIILINDNLKESFKKFPMKTLQCMMLLAHIYVQTFLGSYLDIFLEQKQAFFFFFSLV